MTTTSRARIKTPRSGSDANVWTEVNTPERTKKVPKRLSEKVIIASKIVHPFKVSRFSTTVEECNKVSFWYGSHSHNQSNFSCRYS